MAKKKSDNAPDWTGQTEAERLHACRFLLFLEGFIPDHVNERIKAKIRKKFPNAHPHATIQKNET
jgi:hypothetical protein